MSSENSNPEYSKWLANSGLTEGSTPTADFLAETKRFYAQFVAPQRRQDTQEIPVDPKPVNLPCILRSRFFQGGVAGITGLASVILATPRMAEAAQCGGIIEGIVREFKDDLNHNGYDPRFDRDPVTNKDIDTPGQVLKDVTAVFTVNGQEIGRAKTNNQGFYSVKVIGTCSNEGGKDILDIIPVYQAPDGRMANPNNIKLAKDHDWKNSTTWIEEKAPTSLTKIGQNPAPAAPGSSSNSFGDQVGKFFNEVGVILKIFWDWSGNNFTDKISYRDFVGVIVTAVGFGRFTTKFWK